MRLMLICFAIFLMSCAASEQQVEASGPSENSGRVVLETFVGKQVPLMHADLLSWGFLADSSIEITGTVLDANSKPISAVSISLLDDSREMIAGETASTADGYFNISAKTVSVSDHIVFKHADYETLDLVIKELDQSQEEMLVKYERVVLP